MYRSKNRCRKIHLFGRCATQGCVSDTVSLKYLAFSQDSMNSALFLPSCQRARRKLGAFLSRCDQEEIDLLKQLRDAIGEQKRGLMQKLLTGEVRVKSDEKEAA